MCVVLGIVGSFIYLNLRGIRMKIVQQGIEKPRYLPITITLETAEEYFSVIAALGISNRHTELSRLSSLGVHMPFGDYNQWSLALHDNLMKNFGKVKETL
jgi:hypothetical protein